MDRQVLILKVFSEKDSLTVLVSELCPIEGEGPMGVTEGLRNREVTAARSLATPLAK